MLSSVAFQVLLFEVYFFIVITVRNEVKAMLLRGKSGGAHLQFQLLGGGGKIHSGAALATKHAGGQHGLCA